MVVGPTGGGKTVVIETLCKAQTYLEKPTKLYILNPKVCSKKKFHCFDCKFAKLELLCTYTYSGMHGYRALRDSRSTNERLDRWLVE